jgi:flagellar biosynthesis/type III secretory pathway protein FliH
MAQYRFQQQYYQRLQQQRQNAQNWQSYNYNSDPYFYTAPAYRYTYGGNSYETSQYGADQLQQGVNSGYEEGYRAGQADREDGARFDYRNNWAYRDANYGYTGMYVDQSQYNYYFQQGFQRGYQDGYYSRSQYGQNTNGTYQILGTLLSQILNLRSLR